MKTETKTNRWSSERRAELDLAMPSRDRGRRLAKNLFARAAAILALMLFTTTTAWADGVNYIDADGSSKSHDATALAGSETTWTGWYVADGMVEIPGRVTTSGEYNQEIKGETNVEIIPVIA